MMEKDRKHSDGEPRLGAEPCIAAENLSAELDGEYHFSAAEQEHLEHCPHCRSLYDSYRLIDDAVTRSLTVNCPAAASERIRRRTVPQERSYDAENGKGAILSGTLPQAERRLWNRAL